MSNKLKNIVLLNSGHFHAEMFFKRISKTGYKVTAISCEDKVKLEEQARTHEARAYSDWRKLLDEEKDIDFAVCCGIHDELADMLESLIEKNIPFCTEKPVTDNIDRMKKIVERVNSKKLFTDVALPLRFSPIILAFKEFSEKNDIGEIVHCYFRNMAGGIDRYRNWGCSWMLEKERAFGGPFMNEGSHYIDLFRYLTGEEVDRVQAAMNNGIYHGSIDDNFSTILETASGKRAVIEICYGYPTANNWRDLAAVINTEKYLFTLYDQENPRVFKLEVRSRIDGSVETIDLLAYNQDVYGLYFEEMLKRFTAGNDGIIPLSDFLGTQTALANSYISAEGNRKVKYHNFGKKDLHEMYSEIAEWLIKNQVADKQSKYLGSIYYPTEKRYCNRDTACLASTFMRMYKNTGDKKWLEHADMARKSVLSVQLENGGFPELRNLEQSDDGSAVNTSIAAENLIKAYKLGLPYDKKDLSALSRMADFELCLEWSPGAFYHDTEHLGIPKYAKRSWGSEGSKIDCHNTTALSSMMLQRIYYFLKENNYPVKQEWIDAASRAIKHLISILNEDKHWPYMNDCKWIDVNHHGMTMYYLIQAGRYEPHCNDSALKKALLESGKWLTENGLLHTEKGSKPDWAIQQSACIYFSWGYFVMAAPLACLGNVDPANRRYWHDEVKELMRYVKTSLWNNPKYDEEGPMKVSEGGLTKGFAFFGQSLAWCLYQLDELIEETGNWIK